MTELAADNYIRVFSIHGQNWSVLLSRDNQWGFEYEGEFRSFETPAGCLPLLPLLEISYSQAIEVVRAGLRQAGVDGLGVESFPFEQLMQRALTWETSYWPTLAVEWLENGYPLSNQFKAALEQITIDKRYSQNLRHRAAHLIKQHSH